MLTDSLRSRLEALNRERLPAAIVKPRSPPLAPRARVAPPRLLDAAAVATNEAGEHLLIRLPMEDLWPGGEARVAGRLEHLWSLAGDGGGGGLDPHLRPLVAALPGRALLLDLETCGLAGAALFLVGLLRQVDGRLTVELLLARTYAEERAVLVSLWARVAQADTLATFNGKSFDWPMVLDRSRRHLLHKSPVGDLRQPAHVDLLHPARRRWKRQLPDCKLQTIERLVCRRSRAGDIPGGRIPAAYDTYVRTGRPDEMEAILRHNALDLVTLLDMAMRLAA